MNKLWLFALWFQFYHFFNTAKEAVTATFGPLLSFCSFREQIDIYAHHMGKKLLRVMIFSESLMLPFMKLTLCMIWNSESICFSCLDKYSCHRPYLGHGALFWVQVTLIFFRFNNGIFSEYCILIGF